MSYEWAKPGARCVCINAGRIDGTWFDDAPVQGKIYTINQSFKDLDGVHVITLLGQERSLRSLKALGYYTGYRVGRFRPLISQADDVEMFRRISEDSLGRLEAYEEMLNETYLCDETHQ